MVPIWGRQGLGGPHVGPVNFAIWDDKTACHVTTEMDVPLSESALFSCKSAPEEQSQTREKIDYFTVFFHSPYDRHLPMQGDCQEPLKNDGISCEPEIHCDWANCSLDLDQPSTKGRFETKSFLCNPPVTKRFPHKRPVTRNLDDFFVVNLKKLSNRLSSHW